MVKKRFWLLVLIIFVIMGGLVIFWAKLQETMLSKKSGGSLVGDKQINYDEAVGVTMKIPGATKNEYWELRVNRIESFGDKDNLGQIEGTYYINKNPYYLISGESGVIYLKTRVIEVNGNVILKTNDASKELSTAKLIWDSQLKQITAREGAILKISQAIVSSNEIVSNLKMDHAFFIGPTKVMCKRVNYD
jgi:hypothetical protein